MLGARTLPVLPTVPNLSLADLFAGNEISEKWYEAKKKRDTAICELIRSCRAAQFQDPKNEERMYIVSPGIRGKLYSLSFFDEYGAVGDWQRDNPEEFVREIPSDYILVDME